MNQRSQRFFRLSVVLGVAILLLGVLFGAVSAAPHPNTHNLPVASAAANALLQPAAQGVTGSIQTQPGQPGGNGGATTTTTNVNVGIPGWVWIIVVLILVVIVALIASGNRGGGGGTTVIKD
jgi:disulfide bond formation protein DsbB